MPSPFRSSVSVKTESAYGDETADEVEIVETDFRPEDEAAVAAAATEAAAADSEADEIAFVASDLVPPAASSEARQSMTGTPRDGNDAADPAPSAATGGTPRCEICRTQKQRVSKQTHRISYFFTSTSTLLPPLPPPKKKPCRIIPDCLGHMPMLGKYLGKQAPYANTGRNCHAFSAPSRTLRESATNASGRVTCATSSTP